jgi:hypothetical protein
MAESIRWGPGRKDAFIAWMDAELDDAIRARDPLLKTWIRWLDQYRAPANQGTVSFPFEGAANFVLPVTATSVDIMFAKFMQTIHAPENLWTLQPLNERWVKASKPLQDYLTWLDRNVLHMWDLNQRVILECVKLGTAIYKTGWLFERRPTWGYDRQGKRQKRMLLRGRPFADHVRLPDFLVPPYAYAIQPDAQGGAPWVGERLRISPAKLRVLATASEPFLPNIDAQALERIVKYEESRQTDYDEAVQRADLIKVTQTTSTNFDTGDTPAPTGASARQVREIELWELHARFGTTSPDTADDCVIWYHQPTREIVRGVYAFYDHGQRPYDAIRYVPSEGFYGIGMCEQEEVFQKMESDLFNFTHNNVMLVNSRMIVARASANIAPGEPIYPYKVWITDNDVREDFGVFPMADIYQSLPMLQGWMQAKGERRVGVSDIQSGNMEQLPGRTPATTMLSLLQEGNRRPDMVIKGLRYGGLSAVGLRLIQLSQQYMGSPQEVGGQQLLQLAVQALGMPEGQEAAEKLTMPLEDAALGVGVSITATSGSANKEVEKQGYLSLLQLTGQVSQQVLQFMQVATTMPGTPMAAEAMQSIRALKEIEARVLEQYDIRNPEEILPLADAAIPQNGTGTPGPVAGGSGSAGPPALDPSLAALFSGAQSGL